MDTPFTPSPEMVDAVAEWHERNPHERVNRPLIPHLRQCFGLDNAQAIAVIRASAHPATEDAHDAA